MEENEDRTDCESHMSSESSAVQTERRQSTTWRNGQCVLNVPASSIFAPSFDLALCRNLLEKENFQVPVEDFETPLRTALEPAPIKRYLFFNSSLFHFILSPILYVVLWCALFSSLHIYLKDRVDFWVLCLSVAVVSLLLTTSIILVFHYNNQEININTDVRLVAVNERLVEHSLLLGLADWIERCTGKMQLCCVYWDLRPCLQSLTETLEELDLVREETQNKVKKRMSCLVLMTEIESVEPDGAENEDPDEGRPLLMGGRDERASHRQRQDAILTQSYSLVPDFNRPHQDVAHQLLMTYSAVYVKLLVLERLPRSSLHSLDRAKNHCSIASLCLCQYVQYKLLR